MGLITIQPIGQSTFRLSMARGLQHISDMLKSLIEVPGERIFPKARIGDLPVFGGQRLRTTGESTVNHTDMMVTFRLVQKRRRRRRASVKNWMRWKRSSTCFASGKTCATAFAIAGAKSLTTERMSPAMPWSAAVMAVTSLSGTMDRSRPLSASRTIVA